MTVKPLLWQQTAVNCTLNGIIKSRARMAQHKVVEGVRYKEEAAPRQGSGCNAVRVERTWIK